MLASQYTRAYTLTLTLAEPAGTTLTYGSADIHARWCPHQQTDTGDYHRQQLCGTAAG